MRRIHPAAAAGGAVVVGAGGLYLAGLLLAGDGISSGTQVRGVDIGGLSRGEAREKLEKEHAQAASEPLKLNIGGRSAEIDPAKAGLGFDAEQTAERAANPGANPLNVIGNLFGSGGDVEPVVKVDEAKARIALQDLSKTHDQKVRDGGVSFKGGKAKEVEARTGQALDVDAAIDTLRGTYLAKAKDDGDGGKKSGTDKPQVTAADLPTKKTEPGVSGEEAKRALREFGDPAMSGPVTLKVGDKQLVIGQEILGKHLKMQPDADGKLQPKLDAKGLLADPALTAPLAQVATKATNAQLRLDGDKVVVVADAKPGQEITDKALEKAVLPLLAKTGTAARTADVATVKTQPTVTRENAAQLGLKEKMSSFTVNFDKAPYRTTNIGRAAELINGSVVKPGETWSYNKTVGERTKANGFVDGTMILNGQYTKAAGGGVSAVATTMFNAMFFAGVKPVEYGAHSFYIERYPEGREATVAWGSLDLKFNNDSGNAIYVEAKATDTSVTISFIGTKKYDSIEATKGPRTNIKQPAERTSDSKQCEPQTPAEGFDVTVERIFKKDGVEVKREPFRTHYTPRDKVTCEAPEKPSGGPTDQVG
ncbi:VanW family protein [Streptomyces sp. NBC_01304]|uniref:VanW family protein n=1 Tax=Streptomyces sp. NBC_01304 TaxID=2903818 RepID=UPI002E0E4B6B|nr:VanW family protein [Streptomyces sp. NBC_01304]